jgi:hypothetical protein
MQGRRALSGMAAAALITALLVPATAASAAPSAKKPVNTKSDVRHVPPDATKGMKLKVKGKDVPAPTTSQLRSQSNRVAAAGETPPVGTQKTWIAVNFVTGRFYLKTFTLRGVGDNIEVWVADDIQFPAGDCRNGARTEITQAQIDYFIHEFDSNIYPVESAQFSVPPDQDGSEPQLQDVEDWSGDGDNIVTLVDNVRDENYFDTNNSQKLTYVAGFFSPTLSAFTDRNVMTIDAFDWLHRTGDNPVDESSTDPCTNAPARPNLYEGVFAHEYQHLLESYESPGEVNWVNEGLADYAQTITGYVNPAPGITQPDYDSHIQCFLGYLRIATPFNTIPREACGPENSLTLWEDQGPDEVLADYGAAYSMMQFLSDRYGPDFMTALHREDLDGFEGLQAVLDQFGAKTTAEQVLHDWAAMIALDGVLDDGAKLKGGTATQYRAASLDASVDWSNPHAYDTPGAPPNGSDYVRLRDASGNWLSSQDIRSITFNGASGLEPAPVEWTVDATEGVPSPSLYSGTGDNFDRSIVREVTVPTGSPSLDFDTLWSTEEGFDSGFVQISTDGGKTYTSLVTPQMATELPQADPKIQANLPGYNGESGGWVHQTIDLSAYAGQTVLLGFRYISDINTNGDGWWVDNISVGGTLVSDGSTLAGWQTYTQVSPLPVNGYTVQIIGYSDDHKTAGIISVPLDGSFDGSLSLGQIRSTFGPKVTTVAAIVTFDDPTETVTQYARYVLRVNGVVQPGG